MNHADAGIESVISRFFWKGSRFRSPSQGARSYLDTVKIKDAVGDLEASRISHGLARLVYTRN